MNTCCLSVRFVIAPKKSDRLLNSLIFSLKYERKLKISTKGLKMKKSQYHESDIISIVPELAAEGTRVM